jgi:hypothetical protein
MTQEALAARVRLTFQKGANRIGAGRLQQFADILEVGSFFESDTEPKQSATASESAGWLKDILQLPEAHDLMKRFVGIRDKVLRRQIAKLAERLAEVTD